MKKGHLFILSGPSAVGKTTIALNLLNIMPDLKRAVTYTSRAMRPGEENGVHYNFISEDDFKRKVTNNFFIEWAENYTKLYGTAAGDIRERINSGQSVLLVNDIKGMETIKTAMPEANAIFILPESQDQLKARLMSRPKALERDIHVRLAEANSEIRKGREIADLLVINRENRLEEAVQEIVSFIQSRRS
ncbi:MAG: guanylate kinase [Candidatus Komeilibacteria bacterium]|nr:guanylate kinase [Candidatus Komeilibacteria bacterium]